MKGHGEIFTRTQERAIGALLTLPTLAEAAQVCGVSEKTLRRWQQQPAFKACYSEARARVLEVAINELRQLARDAVRTLGTVAKDAESPAGARVTASRAILETVLRAVELEDIGARLDELERLTEGKER
jgi:DNA-binding transcriptional MerR regulator